MSQNDGDTAWLLRKLQSGDKEARDRLIRRACERLRRLASRMLQSYPGVRRWEQTDDVLQNAMLRLHRALGAVSPKSSRHFYNLAALQIRRELLDLADRHSGPEGHGANHQTDGAGGALAGQADGAGKPGSLAEWADFHERVAALPEAEREAFELLWYHGLTQEQAAEELSVSLRTLKRLWLRARERLARTLPGGPSQ